MGKTLKLEPKLKQPKPVDKNALSLLFNLMQTLEIKVQSDRIKILSQKVSRITASNIKQVLEEYFDASAKTIKIAPDQFHNPKCPLLLINNDQTLSLYLYTQDQQMGMYNPQTKETEFLLVDEVKENYSGQAVVVGKKTTEKKTGDKKKADTNEFPIHSHKDTFGFRWVLKTLLGYRGALSQILIGALLIQVFALVTPLFTMVIIDKVFSASGISTLHVLIIGLMAISLFDYLISHSRQVLLNHTTHKVDFITATNFFRHLTRLPMSFFTSRQTGDSISRVKELEVIRNFFTGSAFTVMIDFPFLAVFIGVMLAFSVKLTAIALCFTGLIFWIYGFFGPMIRNKLKQKNEIQVDNQSFLIEMVGGMEVVKSMALESQAQKKWNNLLINQAKNSAHTERLTGGISQFTQFLTKSTTAVCLWVGAMSVLDGSLTAGQLIAFNMMVGRIIAPVQRISQMLQQLHQLKLSFSRVGEIMNTPAEPFIQRPSQLPKLEGHIRFEHVNFKYKPDQAEVLKDISFDIKAGEVVGVIGTTGSGKTTMIRLLQRLFLPSDGKIYIDGINVAGIDPAWFRKRIGVVLQDNVLFNMSVKDNITIADDRSGDDIDMDRVVEVCRLAGADQWIRALPEAYDTVVGEKGHLLSTGQRQKIAIARALLHDPQILIFDEATSSLDYESEQEIQDNMEKICAGRTVFIVAHRLPTLKIANRIMALENGKLIENDQVDVLLRKKNSRYKQLLRIQSNSIPRIAQ